MALLLSSASAAVHVENLKCEYREDPLGIDVVQPRLSWMLTVDDANARNVRQSAYQIVAESGGTVVWDSGTVQSDQSTQVTWGGKQLTSGMAVSWKVRVWDERGRAGDWSNSAHFSMGLLMPSDWKGTWIGHEENPSTDDFRVLPARMMRKEFQSAKPVKSAIAYICGLGLFELSVNGKKIGDQVLAPGLTEYDKRVLYMTFDVTKELKQGANSLGILLGNGRYWAPRLKAPIGTRTYGSPKALFQLNIEYADGSKESIASNSTWKMSANGPIRANNEYDGEVYDARMEGYAGQWDDAQVVAGPRGIVAAQMAEPIAVTETLKPVSVTKSPQGTYIFDMGQNMVGWCQLRVKGAKGTTVTLRHSEMLTNDGSLYVANLRSAKAEDTYILKGTGAETYEPRFTYHGFRYVEVNGYPGTPTLDSIRGRVVHDAMEPSAGFTSSSELLNKIHNNIYWGVRGNYRSIPTDCPQRDERQGWLGDRSQVSLSETYLFDVSAFYTKWIQDLEDAQRPDGSIPDVVPAYWTMYNNDLTWPSTFIFLPGTIYRQYGDRRIVEKAYPAMKKWMAHIATFAQDGIMPKDTYGDWCVPPESPKLIHSEDPARKTDGVLLGTAYYYELLRRMESYARLLKNTEDEAAYRGLAIKVNAAFQKKYFRAADGFYSNGTQTSSIVPLAFGMTPDENKRSVLASLIGKIQGESNGHVGTGLVGAQWLMRTLTENGYGDTAYRIATQRTYPGWGYMIEKGATTIWELWNGDTADPAMNSGNHVMQIGDLGLWMYEYLAGIRPDEARPGFQHIIIRPYPAGDLQFVKASHESPYGMIHSEWKRANGAIELDVTIPPNATGTVYLPGETAGHDVGSGTYHFAAKLPSGGV
jgi:alpha-L-rhamnosidase